MSKKKSETVLVLCAHNDDHILGVGGTLAKYNKEGKNIVVIIFSYGESSHVWLKENETIKMRVKESHQADKYLGIEKTYYYGLKEGNIEKEFDEKKLKQKLKRTIKILDPIKIFTHSFDDLHPDHRAVYRKVIETLNEIKRDFELYSFDIWNPFNLRKRDSPKMVVDVTDTFSQKMKAFSLHKSQWHAKTIMTPAAYARGFFNGLNHDFKYAEVFYKLK